jgi:hypothetical protein
VIDGFSVLSYNLLMPEHSLHLSNIPEAILLLTALLALGCLVAFAYVPAFKFWGNARHCNHGVARILVAGVTCPVWMARALVVIVFQALRGAFKLWFFVVPLFALAAALNSSWLYLAGGFMLFLPLSYDAALPDAAVGTDHVVTDHFDAPGYGVSAEQEKDMEPPLPNDQPIVGTNGLDAQGNIAGANNPY